MDLRKIGSWSLLAIFAFFAACDEDGATTPSVETSNAKVRVAHLSPDAGLVDVWVDGGGVEVSSPLFLPCTRKPIRPARKLTPEGGDDDPCGMDEGEDEDGDRNGDGDKDGGEDAGRSEVLPERLAGAEVLC